MIKLILIAILFYFLANLDEDTNCPLNVNHVCTTCAEEQNRYGCYCETATEALVTASIFTRCPAGKIYELNSIILYVKLLFL